MVMVNRAPMTRRELRRLARDLRATGKAIRSFDMAAHLAAHRKPTLKAGDCAFTRYQLPSGRIVDVDATAAKDAGVIDYQLADGTVVMAVRCDSRPFTPRKG